MVVKFKRKRLIWIKVLSVLVLILFAATLINAIQNESGLLVFISFLLQLIYWFGLYYFQVARYDEEKITAQYGWPRIYYDDIISVKSRWGDIVISSDKREITINKDVVDEKSLENFIEHLDEKTPKPLNTSILM